jgi:hypothetical protein
MAPPPKPEKPQLTAEEIEEDTPGSATGFGIAMLLAIAFGISFVICITVHAAWYLAKWVWPF